MLLDCNFLAGLNANMSKPSKSDTESEGEGDKPAKLVAPELKREHGRGRQKTPKRLLQEHIKQLADDQINEIMAEVRKKYFHVDDLEKQAAFKAQASLKDMMQENVPKLKEGIDELSKTMKALVNDSNEMIEALRKMQMMLTLG